MGEQNYEYVFSDNFITLYIADGTLQTAASDHPNFAAAKRALELASSSGIKPSLSYLSELLDIKAAIQNGLNDHGHSDITVTDDGVFFKGEVLHTALTQRIVALVRDGYNVLPMIHFLANLMQNPERRAVYELYTFLEKCGVPITEDGHFIVYKRVREDYKDCYSATFDNTPPKEGEDPRIVQIDRWKVDNDPNKTCSHGLHVCSRGYLHSYDGDRVVICKVNPRDVVAIPVDYNNAKMRACRYEVIGEVNPDDIDGHVDRIERAPLFNDAQASWETEETEEGDDPAWGEPVCEPESECDECDETERAEDTDTPKVFYVRDTFDATRFYPASVRDMRNGEDLFVLDDETGSYKSV